MKTYTVIGYYADNNQSYATSVEAKSSDQAEADVIADRAADTRFGGKLIVTGVIEGAHECVA